MEETREKSGLTLKLQPTLRDLQEYVVAMVRERSFPDDAAHIPQRFMMLLEECGEFARAARKQAGMKFAADTHQAEAEEEAADILIILLGLCSIMNIDLEQALRAKEKNKQRKWK